MGNNKIKTHEGKMISLFNKHGVPGIGLLSTLIIGPILTMTVGLTVVNNHKKLLIWTNIGIVIWSVLLTSIGHVGLNLF